jgi:ATP-dependent Clp protease protease subunit
MEEIMSYNSSDFEQRLKESRIIVICGYVDSSTASKIIFQLLSYSAVDPNEEIQLFISSYGGEHLDMMAIYDTLSTLQNPVSGICVGSVNSYATLLLSKCTKGRRFALRHSEICFSQPHAYIGAGANQQTEIAIEAREVGVKRKVFEEELAKCTGQDLETVHADCEHGVRFTTEEALAYGIIDEIL